MQSLGQDRQLSMYFLLVTVRLPCYPLERCSSYSLLLHHLDMIVSLLRMNTLGIVQEVQ